MKPFNNKLSYLSLMITLNLTAAGQVLAQEITSNGKEADTVETISIKGIRGSLTRAMDIKMSSDGIVDAISAEDIGKFPDQNVAESLQRITGVAIDREGGEGQLVSVRGLGPEFNAVQVNGRTIASISGGRAFSFDTLASELINGAEVHKTQKASLQEGAIGATINITTHKPLDFDGLKASASVKGIYDRMTGSTKPQFSALISNTFANNTLGVLASFSRSDRESRIETAQTFGYLKRDLKLDDGTSPQNVFMPRNYDQIAQSETRERTGGTLVIQYQPNDQLSVTLDGLYSDYEINYRQDILAHWFDNANIVSADLDQNRTIVKLQSARNGATDYLNRLSSKPTTTKAAGLNLEYEFNDSFALEADLSWSDAFANGKGNTTDTVAGFFNEYSFDNSTGAVLPTIQFAEDLDPSIVRSNWGSRFGSDVSDEIKEARVGATWTVDQGVLSKIDFGLGRSDRELYSQSADTNWRVSVLYGGYPKGVDLPDNLFTLYDGDGFLSGVSGNPPNQWLAFDSEAFFNFLLSDAAINGLPDPAAGRATIDKYNGFDAHDSPSSYRIKEKVTSAYIDFFLEGDVADMPWSVTTGVRYVKTDNTSTGRQIFLLDLISANNDGNYQAVKTDDYLPIKVEHDYSHTLPTLNANIEPFDDVMFRFAWSKSITRPDLTEMSPNTNFNGGKLDALQASGGNPRLSPFESTNLDVSLEWYYDEGSYAAATLFKKDIDNFVDTGVSTQQVSLPSGNYNYTVSRPMNLNSAEITGYELAVQHNFTHLPAPFDGLGIIANMTFVDSESTANTPDNPLPLPGLGDSQNLILFYEQGPIQFRVAYNNRKEFMQTTRNSYGGAPIYVDDYAQVDVSASYDITEDITVFFEGINVANETTRKRGLYDNHVLGIIETGPRYSVGVRA